MLFVFVQANQSFGVFTGPVPAITSEESGTMMVCLKKKGSGKIVSFPVRNNRENNCN